MKTEAEKRNEQKENLRSSAPFIASEIFKNSPTVMAIKINLAIKRVAGQEIVSLEIETYTKKQLNLISETGMYYIRQE